MHALNWSCLFSGDFLCLQLSKKVELDERVQPIPLPKTKMKIRDKAKCRVAGWGYMRTGGKAVDVLQEVDVPFINLEVCKAEWRKIRFELPNTVICAGGYDTTKGFCQVCFLCVRRKLVSSINGCSS